MKPTSGERIVSLQILRFVAAAMVVLAHAGCQTFGEPGHPCPISLPSDVGFAGVDVFFVLSGFVIALTGPLAAPRPAGAVFFWRRWRRVAPIFYLLSIPFIVRAVAVHQFDAPQLIATFLFWPAAGSELVTPFLTPGWTLCFEMVFYSGVALALLGGRVLRNTALLAALGAAIIAFRLVSPAPALAFLANPIFVEFGFGMVLARLWPWLRGAPTALGVALIAAALLAFAAVWAVGPGDAYFWLTTLDGRRSLLRLVVFGLPAWLLVAGVAICNRAATGGLAKGFAFLGDASYSIYLVQDPVIIGLAFVLFGLVGRGVPLAVAAMTAIAAIAVGVACYVFIERPILGDLKRLSLRRVAAAPSALRRPSSVD